MVREIPDFSDQAVAAEDPVTPEHFNNVAGASRAMVEQYGVSHRLTDLEHKHYVSPQAAAILTQAASVYTYRKGENFPGAGTATFNGTGDVTVTASVDMLDSDSWFADVVPGPVSEPISPFELDNGTKSQTKARILFVDANGAPKDAHFGVRYFGRRVSTVSGLGTSVPTSVDDLRRRISVDGVESAEHRNALYTYLTAWRTRFAAKHHISGRYAGQHNDHEVPIAVAFLKPGTTYQDAGRVVWSEGPCSFAYTVRSSGGGSPSINHQIDFEMTNGTIWTGARAIVRTTDTTPSTDLIPQVSRPLGGLDRAGVISLGADAPLATLTAVGVVIMGRYL